MSSPSPAVRAHSAPLGPDEVGEWFDQDGRLVKEAVMKKALFEVGVQPSCRRQLFKFLFGIYPTNSTTRDRKTIDIENRANYIALRRRWEVLDKTVMFPDDDISDTLWYTEFSDDETSDSNSRPSPVPDDLPSPSTAGTRGSGGGAESRRTLTASRDSGNFTEASFETSSEVSSSTCNGTEVCSECGRSLGSEEVGTTTSISGGVAGRCENCGDVEVAATLPSSAGYRGCGCRKRRRRSSSGILDQEGRTLLEILEFPSKVYAARMSLELDTSYRKAKRTILRDVTRTDRNYHFFSHKRNLRRVHRVLMIYALFHPEMGYAQGMNDILARFLVITDSEVDSYWLFKHYMDKKQEDFLEHTMMCKVELVKMLIMELDSNLYDFFERSECQDYLFCHRWLLLDFKREFPFEQSIRLFEVLSSHYLELNSDKALLETDKVIAKEFELDGGQMRSKRSAVNLGFTFDLFVCAAILTMNSCIITEGTDAASVYGYLNSLSMNLDLSNVLRVAEELFYKYCKLAVTRGFSEIQL